MAKLAIAAPKKLKISLLVVHETPDFLSFLSLLGNQTEIKELDTINMNWVFKNKTVNITSDQKEMGEYLQNPFAIS